MENIPEAIKEVFGEVSNFILLAVTGRTGSGCSTVSKMLAQERVNFPSEPEIYKKSDNDLRKYKITKKYIERNWKKFYRISVKDVIGTFLLKAELEGFHQLVEDSVDKSNCKDDRGIEELKEIFNRYKNNDQLLLCYEKIKDCIEQGNTPREVVDKFFSDAQNFSEEVKKSLKTNYGHASYVKLYQNAGDNIRASGKVDSNIFNPTTLFTLPYHINLLVKFIRSSNKPNHGETYIVIDALRNPYEALFFKQRYSNFYLLSINTPDSERVIYLRGPKGYNFTDKQIEELDKKEYPNRHAGKDIYISQNIQKCIEYSDIHIHNPNRNSDDQKDLKAQIAWYLSLILHPGLVSPTGIERGMQLAYTAKLCSGCISRQVGAVVTDQNHSVKSIGWNCVPQNQIPCQLRNIEELKEGGEKGVYSEYERNDQKFREVVKEVFPDNILKEESLRGRNFSYCFKNIQNKVDSHKNQVHTRSLHAEENAFLQITKYGGQSVKGGILFTTASPCELCSKKAYQLGIKKVIFIDPYPGIANKHILDTGFEKPEMFLFNGVIGRAYHQLYQPLIDFKDELDLITNHRISEKLEIPRASRSYSDLEKENTELRKELELLKRKEN